MAQHGTARQHNAESSTARWRTAWYGIACAAKSISGITVGCAHWGQLHTSCVSRRAAAAAAKTQPFKHHPAGAAPPGMHANTSIRHTQTASHREQGRVQWWPSPEPELAELECAALNVVLHTPWRPHHHINTLQEQQQQQACLCERGNLSAGGGCAVAQGSVALCVGQSC
jgi:hypothetical protein